MMTKEEALKILSKAKQDLCDAKNEVAISELQIKNLSATYQERKAKALYNRQYEERQAERKKQEAYYAQFNTGRPLSFADVLPLPSWDHYYTSVGGVDYYRNSNTGEIRGYNEFGRCD